MREGPAVDVAGGDLGVGQVVRGHRQLGAVVGPAPDAVDLAGPPGGQLDDLAPARDRVVGIRRGLAVEAEVGGGLLDHAVRLGRDDVGLVGQPDVQGLPAAAQRQEQSVRGRGGRRADRHRPLQACDRLAERLTGCPPGDETPADQGGDHLGVGGDLGGEAQSVRRDQVRVVVDVAVEDRGHARGAARAGVGVELVGHLGVGVGFGDDADRRPPGVAEHQAVDVRGAQSALQQVVGADRGAQRRGVVAQLPDLGRGLVDHDQDTVTESDRSVGERHAGALLEGSAHGRVGRVQPVAGQLNLQPGGVAAADLEAVERRQRLVEAERYRDPGLGAAVGVESRSQEPVDLADGTEPVLADGPQRVLAGEQRGVHRFELLGGRCGLGVVELGLELGEPLGEAVGSRSQSVRGGTVRAEAHNTGHAAQRRVDRRQPLGGGGQRGRSILRRSRVGRLEQRRDVVEDLGQLRCRGRRPIGRSPDDGDDPTHLGAPP